MRRAMAEAEVGDDVYGEDPTLRRLEELAARRLGKEAALFVPSGTMANQASLRTHTQPGDLVLAAADAHVLLYESGAAAALAGVQIRTLGSGGVFDAADLRAAVTPPDAHYPPTTLVCVENTHNRAGGRVFPFELLRVVTGAAREGGLRLHLDGARLFNAEVASGVPAATWAEPFDTVAFCLSKGLGAPVGSLVCADRATIRRVHRIRKQLGGGMRQAGILAAAGIFANARRLAEGLEKLGLAVEPPPETNIVLFRVPDAAGFLRETRARSVLVSAIDATQLRAVTHLDVAREDVDEAVGRIEEGLRALRG
jgi:threonine aldolase